MSRNVLASVTLAGVTALIGAGAGYWLASSDDQVSEPVASAVENDAQVLYWYDPMVPQHRFEKPGKSPFMDMDLVPRYANEDGDVATISIDAGITQNLGIRLATVSRGQLVNVTEAVGVLEYNARDVALVQARAGGFVERVYRHAPGDVLDKGAALADLLIPEWSAAQEEYLALRRIGEPALLAAARQRLRLAGMPASTISQLERSGKVNASITISTPIGGVLQELDVREGMTLAAGAPLARINGLDSVWLEVAVPEAQSQGIRVGQRATARLPALPGQLIEGEITAVLPEANAESRTLRVRVELPNRDGLLRPGLTAQASLAGGDDASVLLIPGEAVIRTGRRSLVMLAEPGGRYRPVEVETGRESGSQTVILRGLEEGQQVVASGQFLLDSEASLRGIVATPAASDVQHDHAQPAPTLHESEGRVMALADARVKIAHGPFHTLGMPGMTMAFAVADAALLQDIEVEDRVRFAVRETDAGLLVERIQPLEKQP
ncbi:CzcB family heavy metal RND efflux membrane fusion protein [Stutzerimonas stutzeri]|uniref:efflux RND transporter periplasmic adaptor subunit n=1 Tax=Stutzerimonas stutzeri subgroup TaxID=578833 RepID=UPI000C6CFFFB|nr:MULTISPECIES: efflux RND transporter periplasmic adaptor subunit [Stutzerimonas stutzeri subgroup]MCQ2046208.1 efflux RND transporter periplasmic adaptor subunit [Stutzerimonas kunmingensis]PKR26903.1 efflux RND transporter periplasmic adaptor subunit [Stutzerimonas stutzeri]QQC09709.1 efflux RND transporter periplasmic adaptor subunit [Stutzerimonas stutzeri]VEI34641.1 CzcB family heavy metal RND efflux membrane fusion protein [Stutzerimonas stutzeri]